MTINDITEIQAFKESNFLGKAWLKKVPTVA